MLMPSLRRLQEGSETRGSARNDAEIRGIPQSPPVSFHDPAEAESRGLDEIVRPVV
jgi:hypothetical protein